MQFSRFSNPRRQKSTEQRTLPLTNVIFLFSIFFLLVIFFMLAGHLTRTDTLSIQPPRSVSTTAAQTTGLLVQVSAGGAIAVEGQPVDAEMLEATVRDFLARHGQAHVRLKADGLTEAAHVVSVMTVLHEAGVERLRLLTTQSEH